MKLKEMYTFEELCTSLTIPLTKFCQMAGITEATLIRLRKGYAGRQHTINSILATFSKIYGIEFDLSNVSGIVVQEKPSLQRKNPPVPTMPIVETVQSEEPQISIVEPKRAYVRRKESGLPEGCMLASKFAESHGVPRKTFEGHVGTGLGKGLIHGADVPEDGSVLVKDYVRAEEKAKRVRKDGTIEKERFLTSEQQADAIAFWKRHDVEYSQCDNPDCPCHQ